MNDNMDPVFLVWRTLEHCEVMIDALVSPYLCHFQSTPTAHMCNTIRKELIHAVKIHTTVIK